MTVSRKTWKKKKDSIEIYTWSDTYAGDRDFGISRKYLCVKTVMHLQTAKFWTVSSPFSVNRLDKLSEAINERAKESKLARRARRD